MTRFRTLGLLLATALAVLAGCAQDEPNLLSARRATTRWELVGGPVAYADVGDFVLENDKLRAAILDPGRSWGPGVFGGSLVDLDIRRKDGRFPPGQGRDRFAEVFPLANLLTPAPTGSQVLVVADGSDGKEATIRVEGKGYAMLHSLYVMRDNKETLENLGFKDVKTEVRFQTDYTVRPGEQFVRMKTRIILDNPPRDQGGCSDKKPCGDGLTCVKASPDDVAGVCRCAELTCEKECLALQDGPNGCPVCECSNVVPMRVTRGDEGVIDIILGDSPLVTQKSERSGGMGGGDFLFFGKHNKQFVPNYGFDQEEATWTAWFDGRDTFAKPFIFDYVAAVGGDVSYAYYTVKREPTDPEPKVAVPVFTSTATPFVAATLNCLQDESDDATCDRQRVYEYERFLAVGPGDAASVIEVLEKHRGKAMGRVRGVVQWADTGSAAVDATVLVFRDPEPGRAWQSIDELVAANRSLDGSPGLQNAIDADVGVDPREDGDFSSSLSVGDYVLVARDSHAIVFGKPVSLKIEDGAEQVALLTLPTPARVQVRTTDDSGSALPSKVTVMALGADGEPIGGDGLRRVFAGQGRLGSGVEAIAFAEHGDADLALAAGRYRLVVSHGPEYSIHEERDFTLSNGQLYPITARLRHEVDTTGFISGDFHLHQQPSFDSGMALDHRVKTIVTEGVDYAAATDHDVVTDLGPWVRKLGLDQWLQTVVGVEVSTLDIGHYIGFPFQYKELDVPSHGSIDWYCMPSDDLLDAMVFERSGFESKDDRPTTIIAHPRDGFLGWADQIGLNPFTLTRLRSETDSERALDTAVFRTTACEFDTLEVLNAKRFDLIRTPTVREIHIYERCLMRIDEAGRNGDGTVDAAAAKAALATACPDLAYLPELAETPELQADANGRLATCPESESIGDCKMRHRRALAVAVNTAILVRRPEEQAAWMAELQRTPEERATWDKEGGRDAVVAQKMLDDLTKLCRFDRKKVDKPFPEVVPEANWDRPCGERNGALEDWMRLLEYGVVRAATGGSDSHASSLEPGTPRNYIRSSTDAPLAVDPAEVAANMRRGELVASFGPMIRVDVAGAGPGQTVTVKDNKVAVKVRVETASWYGVDLVEIYVNGQVAARKSFDSDPAAIVDLDESFEVELPTRDSWVAVIAMGRAPKHWMRPVTLDVPFGELQLPRVAAMAFSNVPLVSAVFPPPVRFPDFYPVRPYAIANAILIDRDGNGAYDAPEGPAPFCSPGCVPQAKANPTDPDADGPLADGSGRTCKSLQQNFVCLSREQRCGVDIPSVCDIYQQISGGALRALQGHHGAGAP